MLKVLVTGYSGLVAPYIVNVLKKEHLIYTTSRNYGDFKVDITKESLVKKMLNEIKPKVIIHCAAFTKVEEAEKKIKTVFSINELGTKNFIKNINSDVHFIYISTDQVYPDTKGLHIEGTENPINAYGLSKYKGSLIVKNGHRNHTILQTNIFGKSLNKCSESFIDSIILKIKTKEKLILFSDVYFSPLHLKTFGNIINDIIKKKILGVYNIGSRAGMSKEIFIRKIAENLNLPLKNYQSIVTTNIKRKAKRAFDLRLNVSKIEMRLKQNMPSLDEEIKKI